MARYRVINIPIQRQDVLYPIGAHLELTDSEAKQLLEVGALVPVKETVSPVISEESKPQQVQIKPAPEEVKKPTSRKR